MVQKTFQEDSIYAPAIRTDATHQRPAVQTNESNVRLLQGGLLLKKRVERRCQRRLATTRTALHAFDPFEQPSVIDRQQMNDVIDGWPVLEWCQEFVQELIG